MRIDLLTTDGAQVERRPLRSSGQFRPTMEKMEKITMKTLIALAAGTALLTTPSMAANYLIHDQDGHGVSYCEWDEAQVVTDWSGLAIPADATEVRMCVADNDLAGALERMKANRGGGGPIVIAPAPTTPTPTEPEEPTDPVDPDPTDPDDGDNGDGDGDHDNGHGNDDDGHDYDNPGNSDGPGDDNDDHPDLDDIIDDIKDGICSRKPHLPFC